jgi:Sulfotransferase family
MKKMLKIVGKDEIFNKAVELLWHYPISLFGGGRYGKLFKDVETYVMFIGYPRSGHSLIGSLLDAHPNMVVAHELNTLKYLYAGFSKRQIYYLLLKNSQKFTEKGRRWSGYSYAVPDQWQGKFRKLRILGDKKGSGSTLILRSYPWLLERLRKAFRINLKFIHVVRNPYDNIITISKKMKIDLMEGIAFYFSLCETVAEVKQKLGRDELLEFRHESFVDDPQNHLRQLCGFLGVDAPEEYVYACKNIVFKNPSKTRDNAAWHDDLIAVVEQKISRFPFLEGYSYED